MEYEEIDLDGEKIRLVTKINLEYKDDFIINDIEDTLDLTNILSEGDTYESI